MSCLEDFRIPPSACIGDFPLIFNNFIDQLQQSLSSVITVCETHVIPAGDHVNTPYQITFNNNYLFPPALTANFVIATDRTALAYYNHGSSGVEAYVGDQTDGDIQIVVQGCLLSTGCQEDQTRTVCELISIPGNSDYSLTPFAVTFANTYAFPPQITASYVDPTERGLAMYSGITQVGGNVYLSDQNVSPVLLSIVGCQA